MYSYFKAGIILSIILIILIGILYLSAGYQQADLTVKNFVISPENVNPRDNVTGTFTAENIGTSPAGNHSIGFYVSFDNSYSFIDYLIKEVTGTGLAAGEEKDYNITISIPENLPLSPAVYNLYVIVFVDNNFEINESDETNNFAYKEFVLDLTEIGEDKNQIPANFRLHQNYPNPFNNVTIIKYEIPIKCNVELNIYDVRGQLIETIESTQKNPGVYELNASVYASGLYFCKIRAGDFEQVIKMVMIK